MSIQSEIDRMNANTQLCYYICQTLGATMPDELNFDNLAPTIATLGSVSDTTDTTFLVRMSAGESPELPLYFYQSNIDKRGEEYPYGIEINWGDGTTPQQYVGVITSSRNFKAKKSETGSAYANDGIYKITIKKLASSDEDVLPMLWSSINNTSSDPTKVGLFNDTSKQKDIIYAKLGEVGAIDIFYKCPSLTAIYASNLVAIPYVWEYWVRECPNLKHIEFGNKTTKMIYSNAYDISMSGSSKLTSLTFPEDLEELNCKMLIGTSITSLRFQNSIPPTHGNNKLDKSSITKVYVPNGSQQAYRESGLWEHPENVTFIGE